MTIRYSRQNRDIYDSVAAKLPLMTTIITPVFSSFSIFRIVRYKLIIIELPKLYILSHHCTTAISTNKISHTYSVVAIRWHCLRFAHKASVERQTRKKRKSWGNKYHKNGSLLPHHCPMKFHRVYWRHTRPHAIFKLIIGSKYHANLYIVVHYMRKTLLLRDSNVLFPE